MYHFKESLLSENTSLFSAYLNNLSNVYDNYLEELILKSKFYIINFKEIIGFFSVLGNKELTVFYLKDEYLKDDKVILNKIIKDYNIESAYVPTCDSHFLNVALDLHQKVSFQGYTFNEKLNNVREPVYDIDMMYKATKEDKLVIETYAEGFFNNIDKQIDNEEIYILRDRDEILGFGLIEDCHFYSHYKSTGMYTVAKHRKKGVGRSILIHLHDICMSMGYNTIPGCWYYNENSKKTLESAGYISHTRLLKILF